MIFLWLTKAETQRLAADCADPALRLRLEVLAERERIEWNEMPKTVLLRDAGDEHGPDVVAIECYDEADADRMAARLWEELQSRHQQRPTFAAEDF